jgi:hypothetical protein
MPKDIFKELAEIPEVANGFLQPSPLPRFGVVNSGAQKEKANYTAVVDWTQADLRNNVKHTTRQTFLIDTQQSHTRIPSDFPQEVPARIRLRVPSPSARRMAFVTAPPKGDESPMCIEIYQSDRRVMTYSGGANHGKIYTNGPFAGVTWSHDEMFIAFVAEAKTVAGKSFFDEAEPHDGGARGTEYDFREDFGEQLEGVCCPTVFVVNASTGLLVADLTNRIPEGWTVGGQPAWCLGTDHDLVITGWKNYSRKLGMIFYTTRPSALLHVSSLLSYTPLPLLLRLAAS